MSAAPLGFAFAYVLAVALTPVVILAARRFVAYDLPGPGKIHLRPVPTLGGLAPIASVVAALWVSSSVAEGSIRAAHALGLTLAALPLLFVGVWDDLRSCSILVRVAAQLVAGAILYAAGLRVSALTNPLGASFDLGVLALPLTLLWVATVVNAMNLVDGLDGLASGIGIFASLALGCVGLLRDEGDVALLSFILAGALAGFLPFNFPKAHVFLGDVGSTFVGLAFATIALLENRKATMAVTLLLPLVALALPVLDTLSAIVRRAARGGNPLRRDMGHLHHRLLALGLSPHQAVASLLGVTGLFGTVAVLMSRLTKEAALAVTLALAAAVAVAFVGLSLAERLRTFPIGSSDLPRAPGAERT